MPERRDCDLTDLHSIEGQVGGDLKLLHQQLLSDVVDADKLRQTSSQDGFSVSRVAQRRKRPEKTQPTGDTKAPPPSSSSSSSSLVWSPHSLPLGQLLGCDFICVFAARLQVVAPRH